MPVKLEWLGYRMVEKLWQYVKPFSYNTSVSRTDRQTDGRTELLYQYRASAAVCWRAIIKTDFDNGKCITQVTKQYFWWWSHSMQTCKIIPSRNKTIFQGAIMGDAWHKYIIPQYLIHNLYLMITLEIKGKESKLAAPQQCGSHCQRKEPQKLVTC